MNNTTKYLCVFAMQIGALLFTSNSYAKGFFDSAVDGYNQGFNNQIMVQRQVVEIRAQQCNYFQQTFQSNVPNWSSYRSNNEFIKWANKSTIQANNGQNITVASAIDQIINTCSIRDVPALRSLLDAFDSNK